MPELPDVEIYRRYVEATSLHRRIRHPMVRDTRMLGVAPGTLRRHLDGSSLTDTYRHGKYLFAQLEDGDGDWLLLHFGMTGRPVAYEKVEHEPEHVQLRLDFEDGRHLAITNTRKLGKLDLVDDPRSLVERRSLGPDALDLGLPRFRQLLEDRRGALKPTLMNQKVLAGLGNVWTDEVLFQARVHPETPLPDLGPAARRMLHQTMLRVLREAIEFGASPEDAPGSYLLRHRDEGEPCPGACGGRLERITVSGRAGYYCPRCQPPAG